MPQPNCKAASPALRARHGQVSKTRQGSSKPKQPASKIAKPKGKAKAEDADPSTYLVHCPDPPARCGTCDQDYEDNDKDAMPELRPLKWRTFNIKQIAKDPGCCRALTGLSRLCKAS